jgi:cephalosporin hydroxylase
MPGTGGFFDQQQGRRMNPYEKFKQEGAAEIALQGEDRKLAELSIEWLARVNRHKYSYHFEWMGRPIIQYPQDIVAMQQIIWHVQPDLIVETGIAHGGSLIFSASMLELNAVCGGPSDGMVIGVDIDIRAHNRSAIESHPMSRRITMFQGSSVDPEMVARVRDAASGRKRVLVCLDSNHTHDHVLAELGSYAPLTTVGSYCVVFDTVIENLPGDMYPDRPWSRGNSPLTAVHEFLGAHPEFEVDRSIDHQLLVSVAPQGYLRRVR